MELFIALINFALFKIVLLENSSISHLRKFLVLKSKLIGEALALIQHLELNDANYQLAYDTLV